MTGKARRSHRRIIGVVAEDKREALLGRTDLGWWFERAVAWSLEIRVDSRSTWVSIVGLPMHLWSPTTFINLASLWGSLIREEDTTPEPSSFERARILIETNRLERIEEMMEVQWDGFVISVQV
ncbi:hypothetical protein V6N13_109352 [Hibiscus sabdariffa]